jgi:outer membrane immunogenic protein
MHSSKSIISAVVAISAIAGIGAASAADLPARTYTKAPAMVVDPAYNWSGFYIGGNVGGGWTHDSLTVEFPTVAGATFGSSSNRSAVVGGGQIGYNWQIQNFVIGVEGNYTAGRFNQTSISLDGLGFLRNVNYSTRDTWDAAVRAGFAANNWLFYGKGGYAGSRLNLNVVRNVDGLLESSASTTLNGFVAGAGIEYGFTPNWIVGLEYDYYGFAKRDLLNVATFNGFAAQNYRGIDPSEQTLTARLSYKFGGPVVAKY